MHEPTPRPGPFATLRNAFLSGLLMLAPLAVTWWVFAWLFEAVGGGFRDHFFFFLPASLRQHQWVWNILATLIVVILITGLGYISRYVLGQYFGGVAQRFILHIPGVNSVYNTVKQIVDTFGSQSRNSFSQVVLVQFPRTGCYTIGFLTSKVQGEAQAKAGRELWSVFVPTTPNPTGGYMLLLPPEEIIPLDISVGEGMKMVISGGAVTPATTASRPPLQA
ncbi:DUF502 domain-containing protein [Nibricoccus sp. IMCC34717]|uniref:DUF502 domain-containing protein n=1 Tax=Nibricoccus sp. IMCC34717 TaxID=3034021 RepID=UPI00384EB860